MIVSHGPSARHTPSHLTLLFLFISKSNGPLQLCKIKRRILVIKFDINSIKTNCKKSMYQHCLCNVKDSQGLPVKEHKAAKLCCTKRLTT